VSDTAWAITVGYTIVSMIGITIGLIVFRSTRVGFRVDVASRETIEKRESYWGVAVLAFLVVVLGGTIFQIPYWTDDSNAKTPQKLEIVGQQFAFTVNPPRVRANEETRIELRAKDVSHAVGIYEPDGTLVKQVNILPGVTQKILVTFKKTGVYKLRCLEFCGLDHHLMQNDLVVEG
jgi:cytochrome c oxidase subunit 2